MRKIICPPALALLILTPHLTAQRSDARRPKIGLALEGGSALGLAHIGVLEWLEENRIPIDYVAGTSMGGLIGGLYATGMRPAELKQLVSGIDWDEALSPQLPFQALSYRRKEDRRAFQNNLEFGLRHGFSVPGGLVPGQYITFLFDRETLPYSDLKSFDELPIPFRCVATDLSTGKPHVFRDGSLGEALRATMSLPAIFTPVSRNGALYADGGLLNNLPVDVVKQMGADIVIAVYLSPSPFRASNKQSMFSIMGRSIGVMIEAGELHNMETADVLIRVDLAGFTSSDFKAFSKIIPKGYEGAAQKAPLLSRLSLDDASWQDYLGQRDARRIRSAKTPELVQVTGADSRVASHIEERLAPDVGKPVDPAKLEHDLTVIAGSGRFSRFSYGISDMGGRPGLQVRATEKDYAPPILNLGFVIDGTDLQNVRWTMNARITALDVGSFRSELRTDISAGATWRLASEYYRPLSATSNWFVAPQVFATNDPFDLYDRSTRIAEYRLGRYGGGVDMGYAIDRFSEVRLGYQIANFRSSLRIGEPVLPTPAGRTGITSLRYGLDRLDNPIVPRSGEAIRFSAGWQDAAPGAPGGFPISELYVAWVRRVSRPGSVYIQAFGGSTFGYQQTGIPQFFLGGPTRLNAYGANELRTNQYWLGRLGYIHQLFSLPPLVGGKVYVTSVYEVGKAYGAANESRLPTDGAVGFVIETLAGPLFVGGSVGDTGHHKVYFQLGKLF